MDALDDGLGEGAPETSADGAEVHNVARCGLAQGVPDRAAEAGPEPGDVGVADWGGIYERAIRDNWERRLGHYGEGLGACVGGEMDIRYACVIERSGLGSGDDENDGKIGYLEPLA